MGAIVFKTKPQQGKMPQEAAAHAEKCAPKHIVRLKHGSIRLLWQPLAIFGHNTYQLGSINISNMHKTTTTTTTTWQ